MQLGARAALERIGHQLDRGIFPTVKNGGIVAPSDSAISLTLGEEKFYVDEGRPRENSRAGAPAWPGSGGAPPPTRGAWQAGQTAPLVCAALQPYPQEELDAVHRAYPGSTAWQEDDGIWLLTESTLLHGLRQAATFLTAISYTSAGVRSWGFWKDAVTPTAWIGPRHTNFPDGSICAFFPDDGTWIPGDPLVELLDLFSVWALRHLHLETFGQWPGSQAPCHPYERLLEFADRDFCTCGSDLRYGRCCRARDLARNRIADAVNFNLLTRGYDRRPPKAVINFMSGEQINLPPLSVAFPS